MERVEIKEVNIPAEQSLQISGAPYLEALSERYAERGIVKSVRDGAEAQIARERETCELDPDAYRLSNLSEAAITNRYRGGKAVMESEDLLRYFSETRAKRIAEADFTQHTGMDEITEQECAVVVADEKKALLPTVKAEIKALPAKIKEKWPVWFNGQKADVSGEKKRFPLSAFASIAAIAASLMLIVTASIMVTRAEEELSLLKREADVMAGEVAEMRSDMDVATNLMEVRRVATEEYGMVEEEYLKADYISVKPEETVETFEEERANQFGIDALLSAIGIKK